MKQFAVIVALSLAALPCNAHEIYTGVKGKDGQLCCGGTDCQATTYEERRGEFYFFTREKTWLRVPEDRITFLPVHGDEDVTTHNHAHLCYRQGTDADRMTQGDRILTDDHGALVYLYCAFVPPGAI